MIIGLPHMLIMATVEEHIFQRSHFLILEQYRMYEGEAMFLLIQQAVLINKLAKAVGGGVPVKDPAHGGLGYWRHYHATRRGKRTGGHIFYV